MAEVTNNGANTPIGLPNSQVIAPGQTVTVIDWGKIKTSKVVAHYLSVGVLSAEGDELDDSLTDEAEEKQRILAQLKALGISAGANSKLDTLKARVGEELGKARADLIAQPKEKGVDATDDATLEELQAELAKQE